MRILKNPSERELQGFLNRTKYKVARRVTDPDTGDVYVWDAGDAALHDLVAKELGISNPVSDMIGAGLESNNIAFAWLLIIRNAEFCSAFGVRRKLGAPIPMISCPWISDAAHSLVHRSFDQLDNLYF